jgi:hypothetical protein
MTHDQAITQLRQLAAGADRARLAGELKLANEIAEDAKLAAPGSLPSQISVTQNETATTVIGGPELSAYVNYGTGNFAKEYVESLPEDQQIEARKFFISGKGHGAARPFFTNAIFKHQDEIIPVIEQELLNLTK